MSYKRKYSCFFAFATESKEGHVKRYLTAILIDANTMTTSYIRQRLPIDLAVLPLVDSNYTKVL